MTPRSLVWRGALAALLCVMLARSAPAQERDDVVREAGKHFQRGVALYGEADYGGALVEFKRAAELSPNPTVLFNIGQTQYQLRDYAAALRTFERYLAEAPASSPNRGEVESAVRVLRSRVGRLMITTDVPGADVTVEDTPAGRTPFDKPVLVGVGHIKVVASIAGRSPVTRYVDVAADDDVSVALSFAAAPTDSRSSPDPVAPTLELRSSEPAPPGHGWRTVGWIATGATAAGAVVFGLLARKESQDLQTARNQYPAMQSNLDHLSHVTTTYAVVADSLAAVALIAAGLTIYSTVTAADTGSKPGTHISLGLGSFQLETKF